MKRVLLVVVLFALGSTVACSTVPEKQKPTPRDCVEAKVQVDVFVGEATLNAPWSKADLETIARQGSDLKKTIDRVFEAAGIATTVATGGGTK